MTDPQMQLAATLESLLGSTAALPETLLRSAHRVAALHEVGQVRPLLAGRGDLPDDLAALLAEDVSVDVLFALAKNERAPESARVRATSRIVEPSRIRDLAKGSSPIVLATLAQRLTDPASLPVSVAWDATTGVLLGNAALPEPAGRALLDHALALLDRDADLYPPGTGPERPERQGSRVWPGVQAYLRRHPVALAELADTRNPWVLLEYARRNPAPAVVDRVVTEILMPALTADHNHLYAIPKYALDVLELVSDRITEPARTQVLEALDTWAVPLSHEVVRAFVHGQDDPWQDKPRHALFATGPVEDVLAFTLAHGSLSPEAPSAESVLAFVARTDVSTQDARRVHWAYNLQMTSEAISARSHDREFIFTAVLQAPELQNRVTDPDLLLEIVAGLLHPDRAGLAGPKQVEQATIIRLGERLLELPWTALTQLLGRDTALDAFVGQYLDVCVATPASTTLFLALTEAGNDGDQGLSLVALREAIEGALADAAT